MIAKLTGGGHSFKGACRYYLHDKGADTSDRVAWTHTENLVTDDPDQAWRIMAWTALEQQTLKISSGQKLTGRKLTKPVFAYSLSWHSEQSPDQQHMLETALRSLKVLGLNEYQTLIVAHQDTPERHLHVIINRVHPATGLASDDSLSKRKLSDFAREYERETGRIYCQQREENHAKRQRGEKTKYRDPIIENAWRQSDNGTAFIAALNEGGYTLAQGRKRIVVVDKYAQTHNPLRHLGDIRTKQFSDRLRDINLNTLPDATKLAKQIAEENMKRYKASLAHDRWAAEKLSMAQDRQNNERADLSNEHRDKTAALVDDLNKFYHFRKQRREIENLEKRIAVPSLWQKLTGAAHRNKNHLEELKLTYENALWRALEAKSKAERERVEALSSLAAKHRSEKKLNFDNIEKQKPQGYADAAEREKIIKNLPDIPAWPPQRKRGMRH